MSGTREPHNGRVPRPATLQTVAALAGVSTATASKALNGLQVSAENLERVQAAAEQLGYVANSAARSMRRSQTMTIGIVLHMEMHPATELMRILHSAVEDLERAGYTVLLSLAVRGSAEVDVALRRFVERRVDGLFYWNARPSKSLDLYRQSRIPVLAVSFRDEACSDLPLITVDITDACRAAMKRVREQGHRVIAEFSGSDRPAIVRAAALEAGLECRAPEVGFEQADVDRYVASLAGAKDRPTLLVADYSSILQVLVACAANGLRIPEDVSLLSTTESAGAALLPTPLSAIDTDYAKLGHASATAMLEAINGASLQDIILDSGVRWIDRPSIGRVPAGAGRYRRPSRPSGRAKS